MIFQKMSLYKAGVAKHSILVEVGSEPKIETSLTMTKPEIGLSLELYCPVSGFPAPQIKWFKESVKYISK